MKTLALLAIGLFMGVAAKAQDLHLQNTYCGPDLVFVVTASQPYSCTPDGTVTAQYQVPMGTWIDLDIYGGTSNPQVNWSSPPSPGVDIYSVTVYEAGNPATARTVYASCSGGFVNYQPFVGGTCGGYVVGAGTRPVSMGFAVDVHP